MLRMVHDLSGSIEWEFTLTVRGVKTRYGRLGADYYAQVVPGGLVDDAGFPPRRISERIYRMMRAAAREGGGDERSTVR